MDLQLLIILGLAAFIVIYLLFSGFRVINQYERAVVFVLGRYAGVRGPGLFYIIPFISKIRVVDLRILSLEVPAQEVITRDNVTIKVNAVLYFRVVEPNKSIINILDYQRATVQIAQTTLRNVLGQSELDEILSEREVINGRLQQIIDQHTEPWGVKVSAVELKDLELPIGMQRAMAKQAEAEREKRAKIIAAEGEFQASRQLAEAANVISQQPAAIQLRYMQTLVEIAVEKNSTIIFPVPIDLLSSLKDIAQQLQSGSASTNQPPPAAPQNPPNAPTSQQ